MNEIKVINIRFENYCWECTDVDDTHCYYECPALIKLFSEGWQIKDWKTHTYGVVFILEKNQEFQ